MTPPRLMLSAQEDLDLILQDIVGRFPEIDARRSGTVINAVAGGAALLKRDAQRFALREFAKTFFATARGEDLDRLAEDHIDLTRHAASAAVGEVLIARNAAGSFVTIPQGAVLMEANGRDVEATRQVNLTGVSVRVPVRSVVAGSGGNVPAGTVFSAKDASWAQGESLIIIAEDGLAGGNAAEADEEFRTRIRLFWRSLRRATGDAIRFVALSVPQVRRATIDEERARPHRGGWIDLYVTDAQDGSNRVLLDEVRRVVDRNGRAAGILVNVHAGQVIQVTVRCRLTTKPGASADLPARVSQALIGSVNSLSIGQPLVRGRLVAAALAVDPAIVRLDLIEPGADLQPTTREVLRTGQGLVVLE